MREILFKAKSIDPDSEGLWVQGGVVHQTDYYGSPCDTWYIIDGTCTDDYDIGFVTRVDPSTICQHTSCPDSKGNPVFEGDIVTYEQINNKKLPAIVVYHDGEFCLDFGGNIGIQHGLLLAEPEMYYGTLTVIGNIHDAPKEG